MSRSQSPAVEEYLRRKQALVVTRQARPTCRRCHKPEITCYCPQVTPIVTRPRVVILMHPLEAKHPLGTGRMTHQCLANSSLMIGVNFTQHAELNALITDPNLFPMVLFPGPKSLNLTQLSKSERTHCLPENREPVVIVLDGTWHLARKMLHRSPNLQALPRICFTPNRLSRFRLRKQPNPQCFSTIEAVHELLTLFDGSSEQSSPPPQDLLLNVFDAMVAKQLSFRTEGPSRHLVSYRARKARKLAQTKSSLQNSADPEAKSLHAVDALPIGAPQIPTP